MSLAVLFPGSSSITTLDQRHMAGSDQGHQGSLRSAPQDIFHRHGPNGVAAVHQWLQKHMECIVTHHLGWATRSSHFHAVTPPFERLCLCSPRACEAYTMERAERRQ